jgi:uncharacterized YigZ family protein
MVLIGIFLNRRGTGGVPRFNRKAGKSDGPQVKDEYITLSDTCHRELKIQGSRFLAEAYPVTDGASVRHYLSAIRKKYHDATHHCFAYRLGVDGKTFRHGDDGEPSGTAGRPILSAIDREKLTDTLVIVTRYFGGVKLGTGGLARAYGEAAQLAIDDAPKVMRYVTTALRIRFPHGSVGQVMSVIGRLGGKVLETAYDDDVHLRVEIRLSNAEEMKEQLAEQTAGRVSLE